jgi:hypothetical protein
VSFALAAERARPATATGDARGALAIAPLRSHGRTAAASATALAGRRAGRPGGGASALARKAGKTPAPPDCAPLKLMVEAGQRSPAAADDRTGFRRSGSADNRADD